MYNTMTPKYNKHIFICTNERPADSPKSDCTRCGGYDIQLKFVELINQHGLKGVIRANKSGCLDACEMGATVVIYPDNIWYTRVTPDDVEEIFKISILNDGIIERLAATEKTWGELQGIRNRNDKE
jgi:(2Fe-2S) ferredoxin